MTSSTSTKAQLWSIDLIVALIIFVGALLFFYKYSANSATVDEDTMGNLLLEAKLISGYLTSAGLPTDWTTSDVTLIGLSDGEMRIDPDKVDDFSSIAESEYQRSRSLLATSQNYRVHFENSEGSVISIADNSFIGSNYTVADDIVAVTRLMYYNGSFVKMVVVVW